MKRNKPEIIEVTTQRIEELLERAASNTLRDEDLELMRSIFASYTGFFQIVGDKNTSIRRLRQMLFGARTEKTDAVLPRSEGTVGDDAPSTNAVDTKHPSELSRENASFTGDSDQADTTRKKGHGRNGADAYRGAEQIDVPHESLEAGDACPQCVQGKVYEVACPGVLVRVVGQAPLHAKVYHLQKLRCHLCGKVFTAQPPADAGGRKYDATAASMIPAISYSSIFRYRVARPMPSSLAASGTFFKIQRSLEAEK